MGRWLSNSKVVRVTEIEPSQLRLGDCIAYRIEDKILLHRLWFRRGRRLWIRDDVWSMDLHEIAPESVIGRLEGEG